MSTNIFVNTEDHHFGNSPGTSREHSMSREAKKQTSTLPTTMNSRYSRNRLLSFVIGISLLTFLVPASAQVAAPIERDATPLGTGFGRHSTRDKLDRPITFYLSLAAASKERLPLAVFVQGSGCSSQFMRRGDRVNGGLQNLLLEAVRGRARVLVVEKPGVNYLDEAQRPGSAEGCSPEFLAEHTLPRWAEAVGAAIRAAQTLPGIDTTKTLVIGHS